MQGKHQCRDMNLILIQPHLYFFFLQMYIKILNYRPAGIKKMSLTCRKTGSSEPPRARGRTTGTERCFKNGRFA